MRKQLYRDAKLGGVLAIALILVGSLLLLLMLYASYRRAIHELPRDEVDTLSSRVDSRSGEAVGQEQLELEIKTWRYVEGIPQELAQFETVFWEPDDTNSMRQWIEETDIVDGGSILEIGTGTGLVAIWAALQGARKVVATDINPIAVANASYNAERLGLQAAIEVRRVPISKPGPFEVVTAGEKFDVILSNPPWEDSSVEEVAAHALYDPGFALLDGILAEAATHLNDNGRLLLAYGARTAIERILQAAPSHGWQVQIRDARSLDTLPEVFLPGMLLELSRE